jgi:hypothetical protein
MPKQKTTKKFVVDSKDCEYCNMWKAYGSDEDNATMEKLRRPGSDWDGKECHRLLKLLYLGEISIPEFKEMFTEAGMDYNLVEHCGGCAGCCESKRHSCPDFDHETDGGYNCKISDLVVYCCVCGISNHEVKKGEGLYGLITSDRQSFEFCEKHFDHPKVQEIAGDGSDITADRLYHEVVRVLQKEETAMYKRKTWDWKKENK